jgi:hypothetical protein
VRARLSTAATTAAAAVRPSANQLIRIVAADPSVVATIAHATNQAAVGDAFISAFHCLPFRRVVNVFHVGVWPCGVMDREVTSGTGPAERSAAVLPDPLVPRRLPVTHQPSLLLLVGTWRISVTYAAARRWLDRSYFKVAANSVSCVRAS